MKTARLTVEKARAKDVEQIRSVDKLVFQHAHGRRSLVNAVANGECWVAKTGSTILGYATFGRFLHGHDFLRVIAVHPDHRRKGVAAALVGYLEGICPTDKLFTATTQSNRTMQRFAEALGFVKSGRIENVEENDVELIYVKRLVHPGRGSGLKSRSRNRKTELRCSVSRRTKRVS